MANFDVQITDLVGGTIDSAACNQWAADACKEIIPQLPMKLKVKCSTVSLLNNSATTMDLDGVGDIIHVTRENADSGYQVPCREIPAAYGGLATDPNDLNYYGTATDPVFWIASNTSDAGTIFVKPDPTANQLAYVHHITSPTVSVADVDTIANFPDEAESLVVLYVATRQLLQFQSTMSSSWNSAISDALTSALNVINNNQPSATTDAYGALNNEDVEIMQAAITLANQQLGEAGARLQQDSAKYQWYGDQYAKLSAEYQRGLVAIKGG